MHGDLESSSSPRSEGGRGPWRMWLQGRQGLGRMALTLLHHPAGLASAHDAATGASRGREEMCRAVY